MAVRKGRQSDGNMYLCINGRFRLNKDLKNLKKIGSLSHKHALLSKIGLINDTFYSNYSNTSF